MTDLNVIIFVFDYTLILRLASGHYITKLTKTTLKNESVKSFVVAAIMVC